MAHAAGARQAAVPKIPDKLYFRIGEAARLLGLEPYVLRYWEKEFPTLAPKKSSTGHRFYRRKDVELLREIRHLLYEKRFTIEGARKYLEDEARQAHRPPQPAEPDEQGNLFAPAAPSLEHIRSELASILDLLK